MILISHYKPLLILALILFFMFSFWAVGVLRAHDLDIDHDHDHDVVEHRVDADIDHDHDHDSSVIGSFFRFVGNVIAFPFRLIANGFDAIF